jgi:aminocarboxymuconate-semialdehyde decarboxylase
MPVIDVHAHYLPPDCVELLGANANVAFMVGDPSNIDRRLQDMAVMGVDVQVLSPMLGLLGRDLKTARMHNNSFADVVGRHPRRFVGMAVLPMREPERAPEELERAVKELGFRGATIGSNVLGKNLDAREFAPLYAKVQELDVPVFIHPVNVLGRDRLGDYELDNLIGNPTDTAVAAASFIFGGVLKEFPRLKFYLAHGGGSCPYLCGRWDHGWRVRPGARGRIDRPPSEYLKRFYFDALAHSTPALEYLVASVGAERVMLGTDYPYDMGDTEPVTKIWASSCLSKAEREQLLGGNATALFKLGS